MQLQKNPTATDSFWQKTNFNNTFNRHIKKRGTRTVARPTYRGLRIAHSCKTSNAEVHAGNMVKNTISISSRHPPLPLFRQEFRSLRSFYTSKQSVSKRLKIYVVPAIPSQATYRRRTGQKYKKYLLEK